ncbi:MAG: hypothetical protein RLZZ387_2942, partial [Chloroflexota bacterium]
CISRAPRAHSSLTALGFAENAFRVQHESLKS